MSSSITTSSLIVGTPEYISSKNHTHPKTFSKYECDSSSIPKQKLTRPIQYSKFKKIQAKMMDNGWRLCEGENGEKEFFVHPTYPDTKFPAHFVNLGDMIFILPIVNKENDKNGLGCSFIVKPGMHLPLIHI